MGELKTDAVKTKKEVSEPLRNLIRFLARIAVDEYLEEERQKRLRESK